VGFDNSAEFAQFFGGSRLRSQRLHHQFRSGSTKRAVQQVADESLLHLISVVRGAIEGVYSGE